MSAHTTESDARLARLTDDFREWFVTTALPSDANRDQFDRWIADLLNAAERVIPPAKGDRDQAH